MNRIILLGALTCLTACTAPQGKRVAMNEPGLPPVATGPTGPSIKMSEVTIANRGEVIGLSPAKTITVTLPSSNRNGYAWRLAEIPDPTVLKLVSQEQTLGPDLRTPGEQKLVFEGTGVGEVPVKMWYGTLWASEMGATRPFEFIASVTPEEKKVEKKKTAVKKTPKKRTRSTARNNNVEA